MLSRVARVPVLNADHGSHRIAIGSDAAPRSHACASVRSHPGGGGAGFSRRGGDGNVAAEAGDVVEIQLLGSLYEHRVLVRLAELLPAAIKGCVVADRGFGDQKLYRMLTRTRSSTTSSASKSVQSNAHADPTDYIYTSRNTERVSGRHFFEALAFQK